jgi:hypothetical protein
MSVAITILRLAVRYRRQLKRLSPTIKGEGYETFLLLSPGSPIHPREHTFALQTLVSTGLIDSFRLVWSRRGGTGVVLATRSWALRANGSSDRPQ